MEKKKMRARDIALCALFTTLTAAGAFIRIPLPPVPFTLQFMFALLAGVLLGSRLGALSVLCYIILGLAGLPIFASGGGITYIFMPSFGYIVGFCAAALISGKISHAGPRPTFGRIFAGALIGMITMYALGMAYYWAISTFYLGNNVAARSLFLSGFLITLPKDIALCALAALLGKRLIPVLGRKGP
jgi:biotin transport system substrate-specific component